MLTALSADNFSSLGGQCRIHLITGFNCLKVSDYSVESIPKKKDWVWFFDVRKGSKFALGTEIFRCSEMFGIPSREGF